MLIVEIFLIIRTWLKRKKNALSNPVYLHLQVSKLIFAQFVNGSIDDPDEKKIRVNPYLEQIKSTGWMVKLVEYPRKILPVNLTRKLTMPLAINQII